MSTDVYGPPGGTIRTGELTHMVLRHYGAVEGDNTRKYITLTQVRASTGYGDANTADILVMGNWPSAGEELEGFEVKVSRADWLNEVKAGASKSQPYRQFCDRYWLVIADQSFVKDGELPDDWGMMAVVDGKLKVVKKAPTLDAEPLTKTFVASLLRADATETIPIDVHNDKLKDAVRAAEHDMKAKYKALLDYVRYINKEVGIAIEWKQHGWEQLPEGGYPMAWGAAMSHDHKTYSSLELVALLRAAMHDDLNDVGYRLHSAREDAQKIVEVTDRALNVVGGRWARDDA